MFCKEWLLWGNCNFSNACLIYSSNVCVSNSIFVYPQLSLTSLFNIFFRLITLCLYLACASLLTWSFVPHLLKLMMHISSQVSIYSRVFSSIVFLWSGLIDSKRLFFFCLQSWQNTIFMKNDYERVLGFIRSLTLGLIVQISGEKKLVQSHVISLGVIENYTRKLLLWE